MIQLLCSPSYYYFYTSAEGVSLLQRLDVLSHRLVDLKQ